jgi:hypothetical protein
VTGDDTPVPELVKPLAMSQPVIFMPAAVLERGTAGGIDDCTEGARSNRAMSVQSGPRRIGRSAGAVLAGIAVVVVLSIATDAVMQSTGVFPPSGTPMADTLFLLATAYRVVYGIAGGYITARLAPGRPMAHAVVLGALGTVAAIAGAIVTWNNVSTPGPHWYPLALVILAIPQSWAGARLRERQMLTRVAG